MKNLINIVKGELLRGLKYKVIPIGIFSSLLWLVILFVARNAEGGETLTSLMIFTDATMMSVILLGATIFFEKQEGSLRSIIVSPISIKSVLISKIISAIVVGLVSAVIVGVGGVIIFSLPANYALLFFYVIIIVTAHAVIGMALSIMSKDFNAMLINFMIFVIIFILPSMLALFGVIPKSLDWVILISPAYSSQILINSALGLKEDLAKIIIALIYLIAVSFALAKFYVLPRLKANIMKG